MKNLQTILLRPKKCMQLGISVRMFVQAIQMEFEGNVLKHEDLIHGTQYKYSLCP